MRQFFTYFLQFSFHLQIPVKLTIFCRLNKKKTKKRMPNFNSFSSFEEVPFCIEERCARFRLNQ